MSLNIKIRNKKYVLLIVDAHFGKPNRRKKPSNMSRKELVNG